MKKIWMTALLIMLLLAACGKGNAANVEIVKWEASALYSDSEIVDAIDVVKDYFEKEFRDCTLLQISYPEAFVAERYEMWAKQYEADETIILTSAFEVGEKGGDGTLNPNTTYRNFQWILVRNNGGEWKHADHGYG